MKELEVKDISNEISDKIKRLPPSERHSQIENEIYDEKIDITPFKTEFEGKNIKSFLKVNKKFRSSLNKLKQVYNNGVMDEKLEKGFNINPLSIKQLIKEKNIIGTQSKNKVKNQINSKISKQELLKKPMFKRHSSRKYISLNNEI